MRARDGTVAALRLHEGRIDPSTTRFCWGARCRHAARSTLFSAGGTPLPDTAIQTWRVTAPSARKHSSTSFSTALIPAGGQGLPGPPVGSGAGTAGTIASHSVCTPPAASQPALSVPCLERNIWLSMTRMGSSKTQNTKPILICLYLHLDRSLQSRGQSPWNHPDAPCPAWPPSASLQGQERKPRACHPR